jgi:hypothetical protein
VIVEFSIVRLEISLCENRVVAEKGEQPGPPSAHMSE